MPQTATPHTPSEPVLKHRRHAEQESGQANRAQQRQPLQQPPRDNRRAAPGNAKSAGAAQRRWWTAVRCSTFSNNIYCKPIPKPAQTRPTLKPWSDRIACDSSIRTVGDAAREFAMSVRSLQRLFRTYVGVVPRWLIRRHRLEEAATRIESGNVQNFAELAHDLDCFDQSHLINEFTRHIGRPPARYRANP